MRIDADVAVVGSGFAGSLTALCLRARGKRVVMVERGRHPRFAIGESSTPLANLLIEELAARYDLPRDRRVLEMGHVAARASGRRRRPQARLLVLLPPARRAVRGRWRAARQLLVAASPHDDIGDTHWYRPDFDHNLVREAEESGAMYLDDTALAGIDFDDDGARLHGTRLGQPVRIDASFVVDASGPRGFLCGRSTSTRRHSAGCRRRRVCTRTSSTSRGGKRLVRSDGAPYPPDHAALHHVFPGGWIWVLRFANGITSAGAALTDPVAARLGAVTARRPGIACSPCFPRCANNSRRRAPSSVDSLAAVGVPYRRVCGANWALLPSAAGVIDPLLSTGFPLTLLGIGRLSRRPSPTRRRSRTKSRATGLRRAGRRETPAAARRPRS